MSSIPKFHSWLYDEDIKLLSGKFLMLPPELLESDAFQALTNAGKYFYLVLNAHKETDIQRSCLLNALTEYNAIFSLGLTEQDILDEAKPRKNTKYTKGYFVCPEKQLESYGFKKSYITKLKKELIEKGFIKVVYGEKGKYNGWNTNVTVYQFSNEWKKKTQENQSTP